jgi:acetolactate synthase-1/2/3 large subunit
VSGYHFVEVLTHEMADDDVVVTANGAASVMLMQAASVKNGQRLIGNSGSASMGYDLPAAIGASIARHPKRVICLAGDGSIMMNLQELQTISHYKLPIKIFVWNNGMYLSIRTTQQSFFNGNLVGEGETSGVSAPNFLKLAEAFGIHTVSVDSSTRLVATIREVLAAPGAMLCEVQMSPDELMLPKTSSLRLPDGRMISKPLEDMFPFLPRAEFTENMLIEPLAE